MHYPVEHAAGGETSLLLAIHPDLVALEKVFETDRSLLPYYAKEPAIERGRVLLEAIVERVAARAQELLMESMGSESR